ncbi:restriction endonuclease subunit S [Catenibacterium mitsuokai]|uniref:restriction endonuclease subunit S n=1 Tax=Catenibacterium mitsuokai TaxID=100886 RepID=UPI002E762029|nr:restriction endonuclease subunit S [Catenibacterium mitsuokai]
MKGVTKGNIKKYALNEFLKEYKELNTDNKYRPVAVGRYGIRKRESIYSKELAKDYSKNKLIHKGTLTVGMGSKQIDIGILIEDETFAVSPAYHTYEIQGIRCKYLEYCLQSKNIEMFSLYAKRGSRQGKSIDLKRWLTYKIPVYSEKDQIVIEENLNKINYVIELRRKQIDLLDELIKARFVEMFGDPFLNEKGWITKPLIDMGNCKNGMNFHYNENGCEVKCLGVGDFKDLSIINNIESLQTVSLNEMPSEEYMLRDNDIVFVRSNGNKALVGRSIVIYPGDVPTTFSGFCIRYRKYDDSIIVPYLLHVLKTDSFRNKMVGRGANIQNLNQQILASLIIPVPPLQLQNQFALFVQEIDKSRLRELLAIKHIKLLLKNL